MKTMKDETRAAAVPNRQAERTRGWIVDALLSLMDKKPYAEITISDIARKAGIARQTFYRNYTEKDSVVLEYFTQSFSAEFLSIEEPRTAGKESKIVLVFNYNYLLKNRKNLKKLLANSDIERLIFPRTHQFPESLISHYKKQFSKIDYLIFRYKMHYQLTGCLRVFLDWFVHDMPLPIDKLVSMLNNMCNPQKSIYGNIPSIVVQIR